ncbi:MAG: class I SAM-dependent methyltransferase [Nitrospinota bacterium]|nr:class I SAM-dependent methyltransferase [Nitrospinota bacterium]
MVEQSGAKICVGCGSENTRTLIELGAQPTSNYFLADAEDEVNSHPIQFGVCSTCGLGQLFDPMEPEAVRSRFDWLTYNEPEGHLDDLVETLLSMVKSRERLTVHGVTYKDSTTLERFKRKGVSETYLFKQNEDMGITDQLASLETIQEVLSPEMADTLRKKYGQADILLVRHILEHAHEPRAFFKACQKLCMPGGLMVFEVPDCRKILDGHDHCFLWEEHVSYFTPATFKAFFEGCAFGELDIKVYPYPMEDSLVAIVRNSTVGGAAGVDLEPELARLESFAGSFDSREIKIKRYLQSLKAEGKRVALFGAGHLAIKFINFYDLADSLIGVIDDNPNKLGRYMPGSFLPIIGSDSLANGEVDLCLLTLNPESEQKVRKAKKEYLDHGGKFASIFSASASSIYREIEQ